MNMTKLHTGQFDIFVAGDDAATDCDYLYGGTRAMPAGTSDEDVLTEISRLQRDESALKNALINVALRKGALDGLNPVRFPAGFFGSRVGGARCILRPVDESAAQVIADPSRADFEAAITPVFAETGRHLNRLGGRIKLTPDFGRFAGLADLLYRHTPHVLGIQCEKGGCGGKASYSTTGVMAAFETLGCNSAPGNVTLIGSAGAMGSGFLRYLMDAETAALAICDLAYDHRAEPEAPPAGVTVLASEDKRFTDACLTRGGTLVMMTLGRELENSDWQAILPGTVMLLAHNLAMPRGSEGRWLARALQRQGVKAYPGQVLTLGGALTSRLEWFWRKNNAGRPFDKPLAHEVVRAVVSFLVKRIEADCISHGLTPLEAMYHIAEGDARTRVTKSA